MVAFVNLKSLTDHDEAELYQTNIHVKSRNVCRVRSSCEIEAENDNQR